MTESRIPWYGSQVFVRAVQVLALVEIAWGALLLFRNDGVGGWSLLGVGAATFGSIGFTGRRRSGPPASDPGG